MRNIKVIMSSYANSARSSLSMVAPVSIYLNQNYPKQNINCETSDLYSCHNLAFAHKSYYPMGDNIFFQIYPIGAIDSTSKSDFKLMETYTAMQKSYIHYPSMTLTPNGTLTTSPVIFDALQPFLNNGIYSDVDGDLKTNQVHVCSKGESSLSLFNWKVVSGAFNSWTTDSNLQDVSFFTNKTSGTAGYIKIEKGNFGSRKKAATQKGNHKYSYIQNMDGNYLGKQYNPKSHTGSYLSKRIYTLADYSISNPLKSALSILNPDTTYTYLDMGNSKPFLFIINFSNNQNAYANLDFGNNRVQIYPNQLILNVSNTAWYDTTYGRINATAASMNGNVRRARCSHAYDRNTKMPFFYLGDNGLNGPRSMGFVVYPAYCGLAIQPGLHFPNNVESSKQSPVLRGVGSVVQLYVKNKKRTPTLQNWIDIEKERYKPNSTVSTDGNIYLQANPVSWSANSFSSMRLTVNNSTANFFYMPLYFVSKCRFRMYFKGIKSGKYDDKGKPDSSVYYTESTASTTTCVQTSSTAAMQYKAEETIGQDQKPNTTYTVFASHTYFGSLIYSTSYKQSTDTVVYVKKPTASFITTPVSSYRMPPVAVGTDEKQLKTFWGKYSMDSYYFDFTINLGQGQTGENILPFVREPLQVLGVLVMQKTKYDSSLLENGNGTFTVKESTLYPTTATDKGQLAITNGADTDNSNYTWARYIQNISVNWTQQGGSGSITLDKYALLGQQAMPQQSIGGLSIFMKGGNPSLISTSTSTISRTSCPIFTGYGTKMSMQDSFTSDTITINLQGPQRKLTDLKLINPPFWDGDLLKTAYEWLHQYCGIDIVYDTTHYFHTSVSKAGAADSVLTYIDQNGQKQTRNNSDFPRFPTSSNLKRPSVYIKTGQDSFSVLKRLAEMCNCRFVLQPDGKAYVMTQTRMAVPQMCDDTDGTIGGGSAVGYNRTDFKQSMILSYSVQPLLNNLHNYIITAAFLSANTGSKQGDSTGSVQAGFKVNKKFKKLKTTPSIPWAKVKAFKHEGFLSQEKVQQQFKLDTYAVSAYWLSVKVTIPGNSTIWIYDVITMFGIKYYVMQISHNIDLVGKKWTTQLTLSNVLKSS